MGKAQERSNAAGGEGEVSKEKGRAPPLKLPNQNGRHVAPVLDRPFVDAPPLLIGSTFTVPYSELTPFQRQTLEVAWEHHQDHCEQMEAEGPYDGVGEGDSDVPSSRPGKEDSIRVAPIVVVVDGYTAAAVELSIQQQQQATPSKRYTTLASIKIVESSNDAEEPSAIKLVGVGRVFLSN